MNYRIQEWERKWKQRIERTDRKLKILKFEKSVRQNEKQQANRLFPEKKILNKNMF